MKRKVPFLDLRVSDDRIRADLLAAVDTVLRHGRIVMGPEVAEFESAVAGHCGRKFAVGVSSGTDSLFLAIRSLGIGKGDEVITTSLSWIATANAIAMAGATPVFADIGDDLNIDPVCVSELITGRTKAIIPVHYTGKVCRMEALLDVAESHKIPIIEDASQAFGARRHGRLAGSFGVLSCFSLNPMKVLAACGEAGIVLTDQEELRDRMVTLRYNGTINRETCIEPSLNGRLDTLQAAILLRRLPLVESIVLRRRENAAIYAENLPKPVAVPIEADGERDAYYTYTIRTKHRDELKAFLESQGIETKIQHPLLMPDQPAYRERARGNFPRARELVRQVLCIPVHEGLAEDDIHYASDVIRQFFAA